MRLQREGLTLELDIVGYQYPDPNSDSANWLMVRLGLHAGVHAFERRDPSLETSELESMSRWLDEAARCSAALESWTPHNDARLQTRLSFTEPCLAFAILSGRPIELRVQLAAELLPPPELRALAQGDERWNDEVSGVWYSFEVDQHRLEELREVVRQALAKFPAR